MGAFAPASAGFGGTAGLGARFPLSVAAITKTIWLTRPDLQARFATDRLGFAWWLETHGRQEYRALRDVDDLGTLEAGPDGDMPRALPEVRPRLTEAMLAICRLRPDLQARFDMATAAGQQGFAWWLLVNGAGESADWARIARAACERDGLLSAPAGDALPGVVPAMTALMRLVWSMRDDLRAGFDLATGAGQEGLAWWCFLSGPTELGLDRYLTGAQRQFLHAPAESVPLTAPVPVTRLMARVWSMRPDLQAAFDLGTADGRRCFARWFHLHGLAEMGLFGLLDPTAAEALAAPFEAGSPVSRILALLWSGDEDLQAQFPDPRDPALAAWADTEGRARFQLLRHLADLRAAADRPAQAIVSAPAIVISPTLRARGFNLVGYARGQFGLGEDVRMAALALQAAGVPFSIYNVDPGGAVCQGDVSALAHVSDDLPYDTTLFCTTGMETARIAAELSWQPFAGRRTIGCWPWELPEWPSDWQHAYDLVDEVWAASRHSARAYRRSSPVPVRHMPMAVSVDASAGLTRRDFRLPLRRFLFVFAFDLLSGFARKNPLGCVAAFRAAFPRGDEPVGLVVKVMRARRGEADWRVFRAAVAGDRRIRVIGRTLDRGAVLDLYRACDCFVSLHRAEGFGRGIAEAMLLGKPVIVTGWSGNMDFTTAETAALVAYSVRPIEAGEYVYACRQLWAEPDPAHAAWWMRNLLKNAALRTSIASSGQIAVSRNYAAARVGQLYEGIKTSKNRHM